VSPRVKCHEHGASCVIALAFGHHRDWRLAAHTVDLRCLRLLASPLDSRRLEYLELSVVVFVALSRAAVKGGVASRQGP